MTGRTSRTRRSLGCCLPTSRGWVVSSESVSMEAASLCSSPLCYSKTNKSLRLGSSFLVLGRSCSSVSADLKSRYITSWIASWRSLCSYRREYNVVKSRQKSCVRASSSSFWSEPSEHSEPIAPLQLESPVGQFLSEILLSHPHLVPAAVDQQLQQLQTDREAENNSDEPSSSGTELVLYRRIAEVRANERRKALEEILYALVVQKFVEANVSLVPAMAQPSDPPGRVDRWPPPQEEKLEQIHSLEAYEMINRHLTLILGPGLGDVNSVAPISKLRVGQVYAASVMYGYFLKRVDRRFQLEKSMKALPWGSDEEENAIKKAMPDELRPSSQVMGSLSKSSTLTNSSGSGYKTKSSRLRSYVMSFDSETLTKYATIRTKEAFSIIEKQTEALFGRPEIVITSQGSIDDSKVEVINISFGGLKRLILEAVTFGSFLWEVESYVDSRYHFVINSSRMSN
ncbi:hypothetical protein HPP92_010735 [Vanilla planifolia]|uniref:Uncharacterized protein n=1 Tax=Vanilla planifolia TaxID=51239 RepID=A0A835V4D1_VANPL|nr:hypothetical protein HPP92_010735 [Vanilla planifolia]